MCPLNAKATIPSALRTEKAEAVREADLMGSYEIIGGLVWLTERTHTIVEYVIAVNPPIRERPAIELRFGSWDKTRHKDVKTKYHSTVVRGLDWQRGPQTIWKKSFMVSPPMRIKAVAVPAER